MIFNKYGGKKKQWFKIKLKKEKLDICSNKNLKDTIYKAVNKRLVSDAPLGIFLSGGIDSAIIMDNVAQMGKTLPTFTVGFKGENNYYDESANAKKISKYYGFKNKTIYLEQKSILNSVDKILDANDEPFADSSAIAMYMISNSVKNDIKVALTGDGGDELFGGYNKYISYNWKKIMPFFPEAIKKALITFLSDKKENNLLNLMRKLKRFLQNYDDNINRMQINYLDQLNSNEFSQLFGKCKNRLPKSIFKDAEAFEGLNKILVRDFNFSLLGDMLVKLDRQSMANSLEIRSPFLDKEVVGAAFNIPGEKKVGYFSGKLVLKECYKKNLPKWYFNLPKKGFEVPLKKWLRNDLKNLVEEATMPNVLETLEIRNKGIVTKWKEELFQNKKDNSWKLWTLISYYHWAKNSKVI
jgi:asparagine synthase (glutamine-hydrolysing)